MYRLNKIKGWQIYDYYQWILDKIHGYAEPYYNYSLLLCELHSIDLLSRFTLLGAGDDGWARCKG